MPACVWIDFPCWAWHSKSGMLAWHRQSISKALPHRFHSIGQGTAIRHAWHEQRSMCGIGITSNIASTMDVSHASWRTRAACWHGIVKASAQHYHSSANVISTSYIASQNIRSKKMISPLRRLKTQRHPVYEQAMTSCGLASPVGQGKASRHAWHEQQVSAA